MMSPYFLARILFGAAEPSLASSMFEAELLEADFV